MALAALPKKTTTPALSKRRSLQKIVDLTESVYPNPNSHPEVVTGEVQGRPRGQVLRPSPPPRIKTAKRNLPCSKRRGPLVFEGDLVKTRL